MRDHFLKNTNRLKRFIKISKEHLGLRSKIHSLQDLSRENNEHCSVNDSTSQELFTSKEKELMENLMEQWNFDARNTNEFYDKLSAELNALDKANMQDLLQKEQEWDELVEKLSECECHLEEVEKSLKEYNDHLQSVRLGVGEIQEHKKGKEIQQENLKVLKNELEDLLDKLEIPEDWIQRSKIKSIQTELEEEDLLEILECLEIVNQDNLSEHHLKMESVKKQFELINWLRTNLHKKLKSRLENLFSKEQERMLKEKNYETIPIHSTTYDRLSGFYTLLGSMKQVEPSSIDSLLKKYTETMNEVYKHQISSMVSSQRKLLKRFSKNSHGAEFKLGRRPGKLSKRLKKMRIGMRRKKGLKSHSTEGNKFGHSNNTKQQNNNPRSGFGGNPTTESSYMGTDGGDGHLSSNLTSAISMSDANTSYSQDFSDGRSFETGTASSANSTLSNTIEDERNECRADGIFQSMLDNISQVILAERDFVQQFFFRRNAQHLNGEIEENEDQEIQKAMSNLFDKSVTAEIKEFLDKFKKHHNRFFALPMLLIIESQIRHFSESSPKRCQLIIDIFNELQEKIADIWSKFLEKQRDSIIQFRTKTDIKQLDVALFVFCFQYFVETLEEMTKWWDFNEEVLDDQDPDTYHSRTSYAFKEEAYSMMLEAILSKIENMALTNEKHATPFRIKNYGYLMKSLQESKTNSKIIQEKIEIASVCYEELAWDYIEWVVTCERSPLHELFSFFIDARHYLKCRKMSPEEITAIGSLSKRNFVQVANDLTTSMDASMRKIYSRIDKHVGTRNERSSNGVIKMGEYSVFEDILNKLREYLFSHLKEFQSIAWRCYAKEMDINFNLIEEVLEKEENKRQKVS